jgi:hypothetical protein
MSRQTLPVQTINSNAHTVNAASVDYLSMSDAIALASLFTFLPLTLLIVVLRRQHHQHLIQARMSHLERSWRLKPFHNSR